MSEAKHRLTLAILTRHFDVIGQPPTRGPLKNDTTVDPGSIILKTFGTPEITDTNIVNEVCVQGPAVVGGSADGRVREISFTAGASFDQPLPAWVTTILEEEGLRYGR